MDAFVPSLSARALRHSRSNRCAPHCRSAVRTKTTTIMAVAEAQSEEATKELAQITKKGFYPDIPPKAADLVSYLRCHKSTLSRLGQTSAQAQLFTKLDTAKSWVPENEYEANKSLLPGYAAAAAIRENIDSIVDDVGARLRDKFPQADERNSAVFLFDLKHNLLRVLSYAVAAHSRGSFFHENNVGMYRLLSMELKLPADFAAEAISLAKDSVLELATGKEDKEVVEAAFSNHIKLLQ